MLPSQLMTLSCSIFVSTHCFLDLRGNKLGLSRSWPDLSGFNRSVVVQNICVHFLPCPACIIYVKLSLLNPNIYHSLITFVAFSNFEGRSHNKIENYFTYEGIDEIHRDINNYKKIYNYTKIYEDKIYNKIKKYSK